MQTQENHEIGWKFLDDRNNYPVSHTGREAWEINVVKQVPDMNSSIITCEYGYHMSQNIFSALGYVKGEWLARVEGWGKNDHDHDKSAHEYMRIEHLWRINEQRASIIIDAFIDSYMEKKGIKFDYKNEDYRKLSHSNIEEPKYRLYTLLYKRENYIHNTDTIYDIMQIMHRMNIGFTKDQLSKIFEQHLPEETKDLEKLPLIHETGFYELENGDVVYVCSEHDDDNKIWRYSYHKMVLQEYNAYVFDNGQQHEKFNYEAPTHRIVRKLKNNEEAEQAYQRGIQQKIL